MATMGIKGHQQFDQLLDNMEALVKSSIEPAMRRAPKMNVAEIAEFYQQLKAIYDRVKALHEDMLTPHKEKIAKEVLPQIFEDGKCKTFTTASGYRITASVPAVYVSIPPEQREAAYAWLKKNFPDAIREQANSSTLGSLAKELMESNRSMPEDLFTVSLVPNTSVTKVKTAKK